MTNPVGSIVTQGSEARLLQDGINAIATIEYSDYEMEYSKIFDVESSDKAYELDVSLSGTGLAVEKPEGTSISYDGEGVILFYSLNRPNLQRFR